MSPPLRPFSDEQLRTLIALRQRYDTWVEAERLFAALPYDLRRKEVGGRAYLYRISDRSGNGTSLGPWSPENEALLASYRAGKSALKARREASRAMVDESCHLYRALRLPMLDSRPGPILRQADLRSLLGNQLLVVGTNAMAAYALEAGAAIGAGPEETEDFDLAWSGEGEGGAEPILWPMLKAVDPTYTVNTERPFQARNAKAYEVELLVAPSRARSLPKKDNPRPVPLPEQEWLLHGRRVDQVLACRDGSPARIVAPDPRWFALQKLWLSEKPGRDPRKRPKDLRQGLALLDAVAVAMRHYPLDADFEAALPRELVPPYERWKGGW
jgi:hypothetical protein